MPKSLFCLLGEYEKEIITKVLLACEGNQTHAAKTLGVHRNTLIKKMKKFGIKYKFLAKPDCYKCMYRGPIPGDAHSCCRYPGTKTDLLELFYTRNSELFFELNIKGNQYGIDNGCFFWPVNFDPAWLLNCDGFKPN